MNNGKQCGVTSFDAASDTDDAVVTFSYLHRNPSLRSNLQLLTIRGSPSVDAVAASRLNMSMNQSDAIHTSMQL